MPIGSHHDETGILVSNGGLPYLRRDAGGHWKIDAPEKASKLLGPLVRVIGVRTGFDRLNTKQITLASCRNPAWQLPPIADIGRSRNVLEMTVV